jgi:hypothetical protein
MSISLRTRKMEGKESSFFGGTSSRIETFWCNVWFTKVLVKKKSALSENKEAVK